jgi:ribosomal protein S3AE
MAKKSKIETKAKKKKWCALLAPKAFGEQEMGETLYDLPKDVIGKKVTINLMTLIGDPKKQGFNMTFEIVDVKENKAFTSVVGYELTPASVKRMVRRGRERVDESFVVKTGDGLLVRIKPVMLTRFNTSNSVTTALRKLAIQQVQKIVSQNPYEVIIKELISGRFQQKVKEALRKIYPVTAFEVRNIAILSKAAARKQKPLAISEVPEPEPTAEESVDADSDESQESGEEDQDSAEQDEDTGSADEQEDESPKAKKAKKKAPDEEDPDQ